MYLLYIGIRRLIVISIYFGKQRKRYSNYYIMQPLINSSMKFYKNLRFSQNFPQFVKNHNV